MPDHGGQKSARQVSFDSLGLVHNVETMQTSEQFIVRADAGANSCTACAPERWEEGR